MDQSTELRMIEAMERIALSYESISASLAGVNVKLEKVVTKFCPERAEPREAIVTHIPSPDDRLREAQGSSNEPINKWLTDVFDPESEEEVIGSREREFLAGQEERRRTKAFAKVGGTAGPISGRHPTIEGKAGAA